MDKFTEAYVTCALWSSNDESTEQGGEPLDANYTADDIAPETLETMKADCARFQAENAEGIAGDVDRAGHDCWLTRNFHGSGFWEPGDWSDEVGKRLTAAHRFGQFALYVGDDGLIYGCRG